MKRAIWATLLAACALLAVAPGVLAHGGNPNYRSVIHKVTPQVPNVTFQVLSYDSYFEVLDQHGHAVTIYGYAGEPYARILRDGTVQVNQRSPATYLNDSRFAQVTVPPIANPKAPPLWKTFDHSGVFEWHDHRMHYMSPTLPPQVTDKSRKTMIFDYTIPVSVDGHRGAVDGTLYWVGSPQASKLPFIVGGIALVLIGGALILVLRRRRDDDDGPGTKDRPGAPREAW
ncbi:MAG: hypothetical protein ACRDNS_03740 [Trebonia sp.]